MVIAVPLIEATGAYRSVNESTLSTSIWLWSVRPAR